MYRRSYFTDYRNTLSYPKIKDSDILEVYEYEYKIALLMGDYSSTGSKKSKDYMNTLEKMIKEKIDGLYDTLVEGIEIWLRRETGWLWDDFSSIRSNKVPRKKNLSKADTVIEELYDLYEKDERLYRRVLDSIYQYHYTVLLEAGLLAKFPQKIDFVNSFDISNDEHSRMLSQGINSVIRQGNDYIASDLYAAIVRGRKYTGPGDEINEDEYDESEEEFSIVQEYALSKDKLLLDLPEEIYKKFDYEDGNSSVKVFDQVKQFYWELLKHKSEGIDSKRRWFNWGLNVVHNNGSMAEKLLSMHTFIDLPPNEFLDNMSNIEKNVGSLARQWKNEVQRFIKEAKLKRLIKKTK